KLKGETRILETMGTLTGSALRWYQENLRSFINWNDAEKSIGDRFKEFTSDRNTENLDNLLLSNKLLQYYKMALKIH
ncbi:unnamed protein product, partial [Rotaria sp. Silwood1]